MHVKRLLSLLLGLLVLLVGLGLVVLGAGPGALAWQAGPNLPQPAGDGAAFVLGGNLYHAGGWAGDPGQPLGSLYTAQLAPEGIPGTWNTFSAPPSGRFGAAVATHGGQAYLAGGYDGQNIIPWVDVFDGSGWQPVEPLPQPLNFPAAAVVGQRLYVAGGLPGPVADVWSAFIEPDGKLGAWRAEQALPLGLTTEMAVWEECLYTVGGKDATGQRYQKVYRAAWGTDGTIIEWTEEPPLPQPLALHGVAARDGVLYALGGETTGGAYNDQVYAATVGEDCALSAWTAEALPGQPRRRVAVAASARGLYLVGGQAADGAFVQDTWYELLPLPTPTPTPHLAVHKRATPAAPVDYGEAITYVVDYHNPWHETQPGVLVTDRVPAGTTLVGATPTGTLETGVLHWWVGELAPGAGGALTFTVQVAPPQRTWELTQTLDTRYEVSGTLRPGARLTYTVAYTPGGETHPAGILVTDTLPDGLLPLAVTPDQAYAVRGRAVIWRQAPVTGPGRLKVVACVSQPFTATRVLTNRATLDDGYQRVSAVQSGHIAPPHAGSLVMPSCPDPLPAHPDEVAPLSPDVRVSNRAWISGSLLSAWQPSNEVIHFWPSAYLYLPLVLKGQ